MRGINPGIFETWMKQLKVDLTKQTEITSYLKAVSEDGLTYPWEGLEQRLHERGDDQLYLLGYGSLLNPASAARTIANTPREGHKPVVAFGSYRVFNYVMPEGALRRYGQTPHDVSDERAALNAVWTGKLLDFMNGRLIPFDRGDLDGLREREAGYDLRPVVTLSWLDLKKPLTIGYVLCATERPWQGTVYVDDDLRPHRQYLQLCREGAAMVSDDFERCFIETTLCGDKTPLTQIRKIT